MGPQKGLIAKSRSININNGDASNDLDVHVDRVS
jgi:hypothetical protein